MRRKTPSTRVVFRFEDEPPYTLENFEFLYDAAMNWYENEDPPFRSKRRKVAADTGRAQVEPTQT